MDTETVINLNDDKTLFSNNVSQTGKLKRLGLPVKKENEYGTWFDLSQAIVTVKINKIRGNGYKEMELQ